MGVTLESTKRTLTARLSGELDHHTASEMRLLIDNEIRKTQPEQLYMNFSEISFMDSSGIGLIMGRKKLMALYGGTVHIAEPSPVARKMIMLSGLGSLLKKEEE